MHWFSGDLKVTWLYMYEPPWRHSGPAVAKGGHWFGWIIGWAWVIAGLILGAYVAPSLAQQWGLTNTTYLSVFEIGVSVVMGFVVQFLGSCVLLLGDLAYSQIERGWHLYYPGQLVAGLLFVVVPILLPFAGVGYGIYLYLTSVGTAQALVATAFVGGLLTKAILLPLIQDIVTGALFRRLYSWLRGKQPTNS